MAEATLRQLCNLYEDTIWKSFEGWVVLKRDEARDQVFNVNTPKDDVEKFRLLATAYQSILDKVNTDKEQFKSEQTQG